jgi:hypothetical protein
MEAHLLPAKPIKADYPADFQAFWELFLGYQKYDLIGGLGSKKKAWDQFKKLKLYADQVGILMENTKIQARWKYQTRKRRDGGSKDAFAASFPEVFRYLRDRRFEDEFVDPTEIDVSTKPVMSERMKEIIEKHTDKSWAE